MDTATLTTPLTISVIAMSVIFVVLIILIYTIKMMVYLAPYEEPPTPTGTRTNPTAAPVVGSQASPEIVTAITAALGTHLGKSPGELQVTQINPGQ